MSAPGIWTSGHSANAAELDTLNLGPELEAQHSTSLDPAPQTQAGEYHADVETVDSTGADSPPVAQDATNHHPNPPSQAGEHSRNANTDHYNCLVNFAASFGYRPESYLKKICRPLEKLPSTGYRKLANAMAREHSTSPIFRRFSDLNMLNLLSLQAELLWLHEQLRLVCDENDADSVPTRDDYLPRKKLAFSFHEMLRIVNDGQTAQNGQVGKPLYRQGAILLDIRKKLKEYNETLLQVAELQRLKEPDQDDVVFLMEYATHNVAEFDDVEKTMPKWFFAKPENRAYSELKDYLSLYIPNKEESSFQQVFSKWAILVFRVLIGKRQKVRENLMPLVDDDGDIFVYRTSHSERLFVLLSILAAALLPIISIIILHRFPNTWTRIYITIALTTFFTVCAKMLVKVSRMELFLAIFGFVAIEVVFIANSEYIKAPST